jgi:hypothetical protein
MIDLYYWQHSDRRWWLGLGEQTWRDETKRKEEICLGWDPPDEARRRPAWTPYRRRHAPYVGRS